MFDITDARCNHEVQWNAVQTYFMWYHHARGSVCTHTNNFLSSCHTITEVGMNVTLLVATKAFYVHFVSTVITARSRQGRKHDW